MLIMVGAFSCFGYERPFMHVSKEPIAGFFYHIFSRIRFIEIRGLDDFLEPLSQGIWEVVIPKDTVTEPLDTGWRKSAINVPSPGTIASYRKGRFHVHETKTEWRVHLDRYDPKKNPVMHLVDDAPLILMISDTFMTLVMDTKRTAIRNTADILRTQRFIWQEIP